MKSLAVSLTVFSWLERYLLLLLRSGSSAGIAKVQRFANLVDLEQVPQNTYLHAKIGVHRFNIGVDTAENEALRVWSSIPSSSGLEKSRRLASRLEPSARKSARSRLYRHRFLQLNSHFAPFVEIYKIITPLHHSKRKISTKIRQIFSHFFSIFRKD